MQKADFEENITVIQDMAAERKAGIVALIESMSDDFEVTDNEQPY